MSGEGQTPEPADNAVLEGARRRVLDQIDVWRKELINLARSNRLLFFKHTKSSTLEIVREPDQVAEVVQSLLAGGSWRFYFPPEPDEQAETVDPADDDSWFADDVPHVPQPDELITSKAEARTLRNALRLLDRRATQEFMDKGIWILYLTAGVLRWSDPDTKEEAESPLVLIPVVLFRESPREPYELRRADEDMVINPALGVRLAEFGIELPAIDEDEFDLESFLPEIQDLVSGYPDWEVQRRLIISPFSFHKEVMYRDLLNNQEEIAEHLLVQALTLGAEEGSVLDFDPVDEEQLDEEAPPEDVLTILDADATQRQCIAAAASGRSFVMDGPPGSGKSQTIANVIAELLAKGKTVLFVSEKAAALEVVQKRLRAAGLGDYTLELHSHKATRKEVAQRLGASLELHPAAPPDMPQTARDKLTRRRHELSERARAMNETRQPLGRSLHQAIGRIAQLQHLPQAPPPADIDGELSAAQLSQILIAAEEIERAWGPVARGEDFLWRDLKDVRLDAGRQQRTAEQVAIAMSALRSVESASADAATALLWTIPRDFSAAEHVVRIVKQVEARHDVPEAWLTSEIFDDVEQRVAALSAMAETYVEVEHSLIEIVGEHWRAVDVAADSDLTAAIDDLVKLSLPYEVPPDMPVGELRALQQFVAESESIVDSVSSDATSIAEAFGLPIGGITIGRAAELADLALLAVDQARPEPEWLNPAVIDAVDHAAKSLQPLCDSFAQQREQLGTVFTDDVLALDLESLTQRFVSVHTGVGKLKSAYRTDKKTVAAATRRGKADKGAIALLPQVLEWQKLTRELEAAERKHASALGEHYYQRADSDFQSIAHVLENVRRALEIAGRHLNADAMRRQLARGATPDPELVPAARRLKDTVDPWRERAASELGPFAERLAAAELDVAIGWCAGVAEPLSRVADIAVALAQLSGRPLAFDQVRRVVAARARVETTEETFADAMTSDRSLLGEVYNGLNTNWEPLSAAVEWTKTMRELVEAPRSPAAAQRIQTMDLAWSELDEGLAGWYRARDVLLENFLQPRSTDLCADLDTTFDDAAELLAALDDTIGDIDEWVEHERARTRLDDLGVVGIIDFCERERVAAGLVSHVVERACLERWADDVIENDMDRLKHLRADQLDPIVDEFRKLDLELIDHTGGRVIAACNARRPRTTIGAAGTIKREAEKRSRHMPVRKLLEEAGEVAQALKPCFMMSPLTVSQFLPPSLKFDAVVFDEASQVRPSDAINCVYRGTQLIVAGDDKQLPPTSFFETVGLGDDEWDEDQFDEFESILQLCKGSGGLRELPLKWHYRSQHEDLITYSNQSFYDGRLITFPGAAHESDDLGVKLFHVADGVYRRGGARDNQREAEIVVERVIHWARASVSDPERDLTVGVVAFSEAQASAIEAALEKRRQAEPDLDSFFAEDRLDGFFVKNLENVQGDERDVMIFSIGYGRDENGRLTMNFGPLNRDGGQRRLNVAITRARRRVEVVSSITGMEPEFNTQLKEGARHLQRYLDYAARGPLALALEIGESGLDAESPFEEEVVRSIRSWGYEVEPQVGTAGYRIDIGVKNPTKSGHFVLGVECDGAMYHSSKVARDRDRLRQEVLERLGWRIYRIWGTAWYRNRPEQEQRLRAAIDGAADATGYRPARRLQTPSWDDNATFDAVALDEAPTWSSQYQVADPTRPSRRQLEMHDSQAVADLRRMIKEVVMVEGPVSDDLVLRRVREAWGVGRAGRRIREAFDAGVAALVRRGEIEKARGGFLALNDDQLKTVRVPGDDSEARRGIDEIPHSELNLAVHRLVQDARRVSRNELTFQVARLFGWNRRGPDIATALDGAVDALVRDGQIGEDGDYLTSL